MDIQELTIKEIVKICTMKTKQLKPCKDCPVARLCTKYFISLPKYWKLPKEKQIEENER